MTVSAKQFVQSLLEDIRKFNPHHDDSGRFASADGAGEYPEKVKLGDRVAFKEAYDKFTKEHVVGYVPIHKIREELRWPAPKFDAVIHALAVKAKPEIEVPGGDPQHYTEQQLKLSMREIDKKMKSGLGGVLLRVRWRS